MSRFVAILAALMTSACCTSLPPLRATKRQPLPEFPSVLEVETESLIWHDAKRNRDLPAMIYSPARVRTRLPLVIVSHGIGEDRDSYEYLGRALASSEFIAVHLTHAGTDRDTLEKGYLNLYRQVKNPDNWKARALDVSLAIDQMVMRANVDPTRIAVIGHSAGAWTAYAVGGMLNETRESLADPRVKVIVPMSMPRMDGIVPPDGYAGVQIPVLNITGTCDSSLIYRTLPKHRRVPFDRSEGPQKYLITIERVNHDTFSSLADPHHPMISRLTIDFLRAFLDGQPASRSFFNEPGLGNVGDLRFALETK